jgi:hypothetical protein
MYNPNDISVQIQNAKNGMIIWIILAGVVGIGGTWFYLKKKGTVSNKGDKSLEY